MVHSNIALITNERIIVKELRLSVANVVQSLLVWPKIDSIHSFLGFVGDDILFCYHGNWISLFFKYL